jgi:glycosyltransferase involved in cell wall biosynthesis
MNPHIAVIIPCYNEAPAIGAVVTDIKTLLPQAEIYVYDNNSRDATARVAAEAGAWVRQEYRQGKGYVIRRAFADIDADIYIILDGDGTYDPRPLPEMVNYLIEKQLDMLVGARVEVDSQEASAYRPGHRFGNRFLTNTIRLLFGNAFADVLSGCRVFSRRFVKSFPALARGFEIEVMLTIHAFELALPTAEMPINYYPRQPDNPSKLSTFKDGLKILLTIGHLFKESRPFVFFSGLAALFASLSVILAVPIVLEYFYTGLVPRFPTAILSTGIMIFAGIFFVSGLILDSVSFLHFQNKRLIYLQHSLLPATPPEHRAPKPLSPDARI